MSLTRYAGLIFDMDGVVADSEPVYLAAMNAVLNPHGKYVSAELQRQLMGHSVAATWETLRRELPLEGDTDALVEEYDRELCRMLALVKQTLPGVRELIDALKARAVPTGLASSSWPGWIEALLRGTGLTGTFDAVASAREVAHGKPAPDVYLLAASKLGVAAERCVAIEDTPTGLASAKAAGMLAVQVRAASTAFPPLEDADIVLETLHDFDLTLFD
ncbi:MAG TPA: HAD family phosphatase [Dehalococcoidia bacterium]|nr:HAD family phosphatase [Dehalococcoidia bacterium]